MGECRYLALGVRQLFFQRRHVAPQRSRLVRRVVQRHGQLRHGETAVTGQGLGLPLLCVAVAAPGRSVARRGVKCLPATAAARRRGAQWGPAGGWGRGGALGRGGGRGGESVVVGLLLLVPRTFGAAGPRLRMKRDRPRVVSFAIVLVYLFWEEWLHHLGQLGEYLVGVECERHRRRGGGGRVELHAFSLALDRRHRCGARHGSRRRQRGQRGVNVRHWSVRLCNFLPAISNEARNSIQYSTRAVAPSPVIKKILLT